MTNTTTGNKQESEISNDQILTGILLLGVISNSIAIGAWMESSRSSPLIFVSFLLMGVCSLLIVINHTK